MEETNNWFDRVEAALEKRGEHIMTKSLPALREQFSFFQTYFESIYNLLLRKSLIAEDPYKYDEKIAEVTPPPNTSFLDSEKQDQMSQRLSAFHTQLEFLNTYYQFSIDFLDLGRIKRIIELLKYINWHALDSASSNMVSRSLGEYLNRIKRGTDSISSQIVNDSINQINRSLKMILNLLNEMATYHREMYKIHVRKNIVSQKSLDKSLGVSNEQVKMIKKLFPKYMPNYPFYPELIQEILTEELTPEGQELKSQILQKIEVKEKAPKREDNKESYKSHLIQAIRFLATSGFQLEDMVNKLADNNVLYTSRKIGLGERFRRWFKKVFGGVDEAQFYEIEYFDVATSATKTEKIQFDTFVEELERKAKLFVSLTSRSSVTLNRLKEQSEEKLFDFLNRNLASMHLVHRRAMGLHDFFRAEVPSEKRSRVRGMRIELSAVKNSLVKANQKKHEYVAAKEEQEQMKRLGIKVNPENQPG